MSDTKRVLRIHVSEGDKDKVNIRIPMGLAKLAGVGGIANKITAEHGINLTEILRGVDTLPDQKIVDVVDEAKGTHVEIYVETPAAAPA